MVPCKPGKLRPCKDTDQQAWTSQHTTAALQLIHDAERCHCNLLQCLSADALPVVAYMGNRAVASCMWGSVAVRSACTRTLCKRLHVHGRDACPKLLPLDLNACILMERN
jgi:hypothetical protein